MNLDSRLNARSNDLLIYPYLNKQKKEGGRNCLQAKKASQKAPLQSECVRLSYGEESRRYGTRFVGVDTFAIIEHTSRAIV